MNIRFGLGTILLFAIVLVIIKVCLSLYLGFTYLYHNHNIQEDIWLLYIAFILMGIAIILLSAWLVYFYYKKILPRNIIDSFDKDTKKAKDKNVLAIKEQVERYFHEKNLMLSALSHDIRTPLTEAMLKLELLEDQKQAQSILKNLTDINEIIKSSLEFSQDEKLEKVQTNIGSMLEQICEEYQQQHFKVGLKLDDADVNALIDLIFFSRLIRNLLNNAKNYADKAVLALSENDTHFKIILSDNGPGVPKDALKRLGTPYYRVDQSRSKDTGGTGLGLAIAKKIVKLHHGKIEFNNAKNGGFEVVISLPKK